MSGAARYPRPAVLERLDGSGHAVIEASAGTGKTFTLSHLVVDRVLAGVDLTRLLVVTFTERAAAELRAKIRELLWRVLEVARQPVEPVEGPAWVLGSVAVERLTRALSSVDQATIVTIHSFCQRLLVENAFAHRRLFSQRLVEGAEVFGRVLRTFVRTRLAEDRVFADLLVEHLAPGGSENDASLATLEKLLHAVVRFSGELAPRIDLEALDAALDALPARLPTGADVQVVYSRWKTSPRGKQPRSYVPLLDHAARALEAARAEQGACRLLPLTWLVEETSSSGPRRCDYAIDLLREIEGHLPPAERALLRALEEVAAGVPRSSTLLPALYRAPIAQALREHKEREGLFDFDDMLAVVAHSLDAAGAEPIVEEVRARYDVALIDEFQDTDPVQWRVFQRLFLGEGSATRMIVIGDPKQAIYGFRAADVETYLAARVTLLGETELDRLERRIVRLTTNYRSNRRMVDAYNQILEASGGADGLFTSDARIRYDERARVTSGGQALVLVDAAGRELPPVQLLRFEVEGAASAVVAPATAAYVAAEVARLIGPAGPRLRDATGAERPVRASDIYVLARTRHNTRAVAELLAARGIPFAFYKLAGLFGTDEVAELADVLAAVAAPYDRVARARAWLTRFFELRPSEVEAALDASDEHPLVARLLAWHQLARRRDYGRLFGALLDDSGLVRRAALAPGRRRAVVNVQRALQLLGDAARQRQLPPLELVDVLRRWMAEVDTPGAQDAGTQPLETDQAAVQLMTMHVAKGLEAPIVFVVGGITAGPPDPLQVFRDDARTRRAWLGKRPPEDVKARIAREKLGESERLMYVALTRAKARMYLPLVLSADDEGEPAALTGAYDVVNRRVARLHADGLDPALFELVPGQTESPAAPAAALARWTPGIAALEPIAEAARRARELAWSRRGTIVTSFSALAASEEARAVADVEREEARAEPVAIEAPPEQLVTSSVVGQFLHDALEQLDLRQVRALSPEVGLGDDPVTRAVVEPLADLAGIASVQRAHAYRLLDAALRMPFEAGAAGQIPGVAALDRVLRETEFMFPIPEAGHPLLGQPAADDARFSIERGVVKGFVDVVFEHAGKVYFGDWKSSLLRDTSPEAIARYVEEHFRWQIVVYGVAVLRVLGIRDEQAYEQRFGGVAYFFLRAMEQTPPGEPARGVWFQRPSWETVTTWERLLRDRELGGRRGGA